MNESAERLIEENKLLIEQNRCLRAVRNLNRNIEQRKANIEGLSDTNYNDRATIKHHEMRIREIDALLAGHPISADTAIDLSDVGL